MPWGHEDTLIWDFWIGVALLTFYVECIFSKHKNIVETVQGMKVA